MDARRGQGLAHGLRKVRQKARPRRLHDGQAHAVCRRILRPQYAGFVFVIQIIMLNKAEIPVRRFDDLLKQLQPVVEGKSHEADFSLGFQLFYLFNEAEGNDLFLPAAVHDHVDMVKVDDVRADSPPRFVKHPFEIVRRLHDPPRRLRRDVYPVAPAVGQGLAYGQLALSAQIHPSRVDVVDAAVDGPMDHIDGLVHVDGLAVGQHGQAQHAEAQG